MAGYFSQDFIDRVLSATSIVNIVSRYTHLVKKGPRYLGLCPFHNEKTPSFTVTEDKGMFYCFGCSEGGNVFSFIMKMENYTFPEAVEYLANLANIPLEYEKTNPGETKNYASKKIINNINKEAGNFYYLNFIHSQKAREYIKNRGISEQSAKDFAIGVAAEGFDSLYKHLIKKGFSLEDCLLSTLVVKGKDNKYYDYFRNRLMFPIVDTSKNVVGFGGRVFDASEPKYLNSRETSLFHKQHILYNLNRARTVKDRPLLVVEGYMDVVGLYNSGIKEAVACLGTAFGESHASLIAKNCENGVILCFDGDAAGTKATLRAGKILNVSSVPVRIVTLPPEHDPDSFVKENGKDAFYALYENAKDYFEFAIDCFAKDTNFKNIDSVNKFILNSIGFLKEEADPLKMTYYLKTVSNYSSVPINILADRAKNYKSISENFKKIEKEDDSNSPKILSKEAKACEKLLSKMMSTISAYNAILNMGFSEKLIDDDENKKIFKIIKDCYSVSEKFELSQEMCYNNNLANKLSFLLISSDSVTMSECADCVKTLKISELETEIKGVKDRIISGQKQDENGEEKDLLAYFAELKSKLAKIETGSDKYGR